VSTPEHVNEDKVRGKPAKFAEHYAQARLFYESQTPPEQAHIAQAFRFELSKVKTPAVRARVVAHLVHVAPGLAATVAEGLGMEVPPAAPPGDIVPPPAYAPSPSLSLLARAGGIGVATRRVAILVGDGVDGAGVEAVRAALLRAQAVPLLLAIRLGPCAVAGADSVAPDLTLEAAPSVLFDAVIVPDGAERGTLAGAGQALEFLRQQFRHCKPIFAWGGGAALLAAAGVPVDPGGGRVDPALLVAAHADDDAALNAFLLALGGHRAYQRETDPPRV
jgi:catalase